jgi:hypothetical protein
MGHGTPLDGKDDIGAPGAFMLDAGIASTRHIARFWGLTETGSELSLAAEPTPEPRGGLSSRSSRPGPTSAAGVGKVIEDALRTAGLLR